MKEVVIILILILLAFFFGYLFSRHLNNESKKATVNSSFIEARLAECSDLTTCNLEYVDLVKYVSGTIPLFTKRSFSMIYQANIRAGIDLSEAKVTMTNKETIVTLPETKIQSIDVDTETLRFYDEHFALFSWNDKEDISNAIKMAREDATEHANLDRLRDQARQQAEAVITKLIEPTLSDGRKLVIK